MIDVFVDRRPEHRTAVPREEVRKIGAATEEADSEWCSGNDHLIVRRPVIANTITSKAPERGRKDLTVPSPLHKGHDSSVVLFDGSLYAQTLRRSRLACASMEPRQPGLSERPPKS